MRGNQVYCGPYERGAMILARNLEIAEWSEAARSNICEVPYSLSEVDTLSSDLA
jgi:hypothetical protein